MVLLLSDVIERVFYVDRNLMIDFLRNIVRQHGVSVIDLFSDSSGKRKYFNLPG